jgi:hypothetical protein
MLEVDVHGLRSCCFFTARLRVSNTSVAQRSDVDTDRAILDGACRIALLRDKPHVRSSEILARGLCMASPEPMLPADAAIRSIPCRGTESR